MGRGQKVFRLIASVWLLYHLVTILIMPNMASYTGRRLGPVIQNYGAILGLNLSWNFFSPDPAHTMYLKFTVGYEDENGNESHEPVEIYMPETKDSADWSTFKRRELYAMRFMIIDPKRIDLVLGPWLCRSHPGATRVRIEHIVNSIPSLDEAFLFREQEVEGLGKEFDTVDHEYRCSHVKDEAS